MILPPVELLAREGPPLRLHLLGVAGSGMSGLAGLLLRLGHEVSGSDRAGSDEVRRLQAEGLVFSTPHTAAVVRGVDAVIHSSAIRADNVAMAAAREMGIPCLRRAEALAAVARRRRAIVVSGTHGKTTTTAMLAHMLREAGLKPGHYVGAEIPLLGRNAHWDDRGEWFVAEGDESDGTLVEYAPEHAVILNIEEEHLDHYRGLDEILDVFQTLAGNCSGSVVYCLDDPGSAQVGSPLASAVSYGLDAAADVRAADVRLDGSGSGFRAHLPGRETFEVELPLPGMHNVRNALAALAVAGVLLGVATPPLIGALRGFRGARRRFETRYRSRRFHLVDDYGHHPTEIRATLDSARVLAGEGRVLCLFQPHRYSRTVKLKDQFAPAFAPVDKLWVTDIYPASEPALDGVDGGLVSDLVNASGGRRAVHARGFSTARLQMGNALRCGDVALTLGAGNVHECAGPLARDLEIADALTDTSGEPDLVLRLYEPMRKHTTMLVGGPARFWAEPETHEGFAALVRWCRAHDLPVRVVGRGSNLLVRDGGISGLVIHPARGVFRELEVGEGTIRAGAGVKFKAVAGKAREARLGGFEWMEGIPGSVGGGLRMNAGAMGTETFDQVVSVLVLNRHGELEERAAEDIPPRYRDVPALADEFALAATFRGQPSTPVEQIDAALEASRGKRRSSQPVAASAGCVFKNPDLDAAGRLVEEAGLKGARRGAAEVSGVHGNFIVNTGGARAADVLSLIEAVRRGVQAARGVTMETEIEITGEDELLF